jgi:CheY-like chemotaxis protein
MQNHLRREHPLILVIDNEQEVLNEVTAAFSSAGWSCCCCTRADDALAAAQKSQPDLILCDMSLLGKSGPETCRQIKQQPGLEDVPVMFLSTAQTPDIIRRSHLSGGVYCVRKPFDPGVLVELIESALRTPQLATADAVEA